VSETQIVRCVVHPGIGVARIGNSPTDYFVGPEVPGHAPDPGGSSYKDAQGRIKRQAARFRLYGLDASGAVVREITSAEAEVAWTVHLANKKAAWYRFTLALDTPEAAAGLSPAMRNHRRNAGIVGPARQGLVIDGGTRSVKGAGAHGTASFDTGSFLGQRVNLGELRTDAQGRVLSGPGRSFSPHNTPLTTFANNDGWCDDIADGPVSAHVVLKGQPLPVTPAWVLVAPPDYAPAVRAIVTLYDIAVQAALDAHLITAPATVSFTHDIYPLLERFDRLQWVNEGFYQGYGWKGQDALLDPGRLSQLSRADAAHAAARQEIYVRFRDPAYHTMQENAWPRVYGDSFDQPPQYPQQFLALTREQYRRLTAWTQGHFTDDWTGTPPTLPTDLDALPAAARPGALDEAALSACAGGPFHPGTEATWPLRRPSMYAGFCRLNARPDSQAEPDYGDELTPTRALGTDGPLHRSGPGDLTRWMAVPWQADTSSCGSAYPNATKDATPLPDLPTFWPAAVPNKILTQQAYGRIMNGSLGADVRQGAFKQRVAWGRHLSPDFVMRIAQFITAWSTMGVIVHQPGPAHDPAYPADFYVEQDNPSAAGAPTPAVLQPPVGEAGGGGGGLTPLAVNDDEAVHQATPTQPPLSDWRAHL